MKKPSPDAKKGAEAGFQDRPPNFRVADGRLYLVRCYNCGGDRGTENYALSVSSGQCAFCGWQESALSSAGGGEE